MFIDPWQLAILVLVALLVGLLVPAVVQLRATLRTIENIASKSGSRLESVLQNAQLSSERIERLTRGIEGGERQVSELMQRLEEANAILRRLSRTAHFASSMGAAVGPAVMAAIQAYQNAKVEAATGEPGAPPDATAEQGGFIRDRNRAKGDSNNGKSIE